MAKGQKNQSEEFEYDDKQAIRFILDFIPQQDKADLTEEKVQFILDAIEDYYFSEGLISDDYDDDEETVEEASIDEEEMLKFVSKEAEENNIHLTHEQIQLILEGEFEYGVSIGIYEPED